MDTPTESELWLLAHHRSLSAANTLAQLGTGTLPAERKLDDIRKALHDLRSATCAAQAIEVRLRHGKAGI